MKIKPGGWCSHCGSTEHLIKNGGVKERKAFICRKCNTVRMKKYRKSNKKRICDISRRSVLKFYYKQYARLKVSWALKSGKLKKPKICPCCKKHKKVEAHHNDYSKPLKVKWLCRQCHADKHKKNGIK